MKKLDNKIVQRIFYEQEKVTKRYIKLHKSYEIKEIEIIYQNTQKHFLFPNNLYQIMC